MYHSVESEVHKEMSTTMYPHQVMDGNHHIQKQFHELSICNFWQSEQLLLIMRLVNKLYACQ
jgi:hypothetical protein